MIGPRESVIMADDFDAMVNWYQDVLGFRSTFRTEDEYHYCTLESGIKIGIASAKEMGVKPTDRRQNTVVLQFDVPDVAAFFKHIEEKGGTATFGPSYDKTGDFWFGGIEDLEGNPIWVVDVNA